MKRTARINIELASEELSKILFQTLLPETKKPATSRSKVSLQSQDKDLTIYIEARDTSAFRATLNSYLRLVVLVNDTYNAAIDLEK